MVFHNIPKIKHTLGFQLITIVFSFYVIITISVTIVHMVLEYTNAREEVTQDLEKLGNVFAPGIAESLWNLDPNQLSSILKGMLKDAILSEVVVVDSKGRRTAASVAANRATLSEETVSPQDGIPNTYRLKDHITHKFPIIYVEDGKSNEVGEVWLYSDSDVILQKVKQGYIYIVVNAIIKTLALWIIFLVVSRKILSKPLSQLAHVTSQVNLNNLENQKIDVVSSQDNELTDLQKTFNNMLENIEKQNKELRLANEIKDEFLANISHELRTPLTGMLGFARRGIKNAEKADTQKIVRYFTEINVSGERLLSLLNNVLDLTKLEARKMRYEMQPFNLTESVERVVQELEGVLEEKALQLEIIPPDFETLAYGDRESIAQVIRNLLTNAIKFTPQGKRIVVTYTPAHLPKGRRKQDIEILSGVTVSIWNEGTDILEEEFDMVFDKFVQSSLTKTGAGGTGLGLPICKEIIEQHQGKIWVVNGAEGGPRFSFTIRKGGDSA